MSCRLAGSHLLRIDHPALQPFSISCFDVTSEERDEVGHARSAPARNCIPSGTRTETSNTDRGAVWLRARKPIVAELDVVEGVEIVSTPALASSVVPPIAVTRGSVAGKSTLDTICFNVREHIGATEPLSPALATTEIWWERASSRTACRDPRLAADKQRSPTPKLRDRTSPRLCRIAYRMAVSSGWILGRWDDHQNPSTWSNGVSHFDVLRCLRGFPMSR